MSEESIGPRLRGAFDDAQVETLGRVIEDIRGSVVTRSEFERLELMVQELLERVRALGAEEEVPAEDIAIIGAVVAHHLGRNVRVRGARRVRPAHPSTWAMDGRVTFQGRR